MFKGLSSAWESTRLWAASALAPVAIPKVKPKEQALPSYLKTAAPDPNTVLARNDRNTVNQNLETIRTGVDSRAVIRDFVQASPDLSAAVFAYGRTAITPHYTAVAKSAVDGTFDRDATALLQQLLVRFDILGNYDDGFTGSTSMRSNSESLVRELLMYGAMSLELVLDKGRLPKLLQPVSVSQIFFYPDKNGGLRPEQRLSGAKIDLDIPTYFYTALDQDLLEAYATSPLNASIQPVLQSIEFFNDLRRIVKKSVHPRMVVTVDTKKFLDNLPPDAKKDSDSMTGAMNSLISELESRVNGLEPADALVIFDVLKAELLNNGNTSLNQEYSVLTQIIDAKLATGAKALPSILGHGSGSANIASVEAMLFLKNVQGAVQEKVNELYSRALTLALRLFGLDVYVEFRYGAIDLRPDAELEAFKTMRQSRVLEQLSLGFITDDQASIELTGQLTPVGFTSLQGTHFFSPQPAGANPYSGTSSGSGGGGGALNQGLKPKTPQQGKGPAKQ